MAHPSNRPVHSSPQVVTPESVLKHIVRPIQQASMDNLDKDIAAIEAENQTLLQEFKALAEESRQLQNDIQTGCSSMKAVSTG